MFSTLIKAIEILNQMFDLLLWFLSVKDEDMAEKITVVIAPRELQETARVGIEGPPGRGTLRQAVYLLS
jgi:hypothetical protein